MNLLSRNVRLLSNSANEIGGSPTPFSREVLDSRPTTEDVKKDFQATALYILSNNR